MSQWNMDVVGSCAHHNCSLNELCVGVIGTTRSVCKIAECSSPPSFLNADLVIEPNTQTVFGIGLVKSYQLKEGYMSSSNEHDFQMTCHDDGKWIDYQSGNNEHIIQCDFLKQSSSVESLQLDTQFVQIPMVQLKDGRKWMIIQRRCTGTVNFLRTKGEYKTGFGSLDSEFWIGNEAIHRLTFGGYHILHVEVLADDIWYFGQYSWFDVASEANGFQVQFNNFTGNISETLSYFNGMQFSAWDDDNDKATVNCALTNNGGWWFRECHRANVNGLYGERSTKGLSWLMSEGDWIYPSRVIMMLQKPL
nr:ryncolin-4-like [Crassostrea gigas]